MRKLVLGSRLRLMLLIVLAVLLSVRLILYASLAQRHPDALDAQEEALRLARLAATGQERLIDSAYRLLIALLQLPCALRSLVREPHLSLITRVDDLLYGNHRPQAGAGRVENTLRAPGRPGGQTRRRIDTGVFHSSWSARPDRF